MNKKVPFDPGFAPMVYSFTDNIKAVENLLFSTKIPNQRRFNFQKLQPQITGLVKNSISFYKGCLMWAKYIKETFPEAEIENNPFFGVDLKSKNITEDELYSEVNLLIAYMNKYPEDCKFYLGKTLSFPSEWVDIAKTYKEFLSLNQSFINTKFALDIKLPQNISEIIINTNEKNKETIDKVIKERKIDILLEN